MTALNPGGVNDSLTRLNGVQNVRIDLQTNRVTVTPHPSRTFPFSSIPERIRAAGFEPDDMYIVARGSVVDADGRTSFRITNWQRTFPLDMPDASDKPVTLRANVQFDRDPPLLTKRTASEDTD